MTEELGYRVPDNFTFSMWTLKAYDKNIFYEECLRELKLYNVDFSEEDMNKIREKINAEIDFIRDNEENIKII